MVYFDRLNRGIEERYNQKARKRLKQNLPSEEGRGTHKLARFIPECRESY